VNPRPAEEKASLFRNWALMFAVVWPVVFVVLGAISGDFDGGAVARSFVIAVAISAGSALGQARRRGRPDR
jgi:hypothetical protein